MPLFLFFSAICSLLLFFLLWKIKGERGVGVGGVEMGKVWNGEFYSAQLVITLVTKAVDKQGRLASCACA